MSPKVDLKRLRVDAILPCYMSEAASGGDLCAAIDKPLVLKPMERVAVGTGLAMAIEPGFEGQVRPRSGMALKEGVTVLNAPGTIDADYRGEVKVLLINFGEKSVQIAPGQRIAQLVIAAVTQATFVETDVLGVTKRGIGGFGSTGAI